MLLFVNELEAEASQLLEAFIGSEAGKIEVAARLRAIRRAYTNRVAQSFKGLSHMVEAGMSSS
jgi:hypothetical protein